MRDAYPAETRVLLASSALVFWDFDGVIKESVNVKTLAYEKLFLPFGPEIAARVRQHHERHGGVSRFDKIPLYLAWAGAGSELCEEYCDRFSDSVVQAVIDSPWVPGVREYLLQHCEEQYFVLVTATPQEEIELILRALDIHNCFREVHGAPTTKTCAIEATLCKSGCSPSRAVMVGDAETDLRAAQANSVNFILRCTPLNLSIQISFDGPMLENLDHE
jgi:phosphoglycolate phosphatase-like HAD superfamily hydrolase